jgi:ribosomal protein S27AE
MSNRYSDEKAHARCLYCGQEFEHHIPKKVLDEHKNALLIVQLYCGKPCEIASQREIERIRLERENQKPHPREKFCPKCGFVPYTMHQKHRKDCPKCASFYEWREVKENE